MKNKEIKETLELYYNLLTPRPIRKQLALLENAIENITQQKFNISETKKPATDRDIIECIQESYSLIYCMMNGLKYETFDIREHLKKDKYFDWIVEYKMEHFSNEIFQELGMELVEKNNEGFIVRDVDKKGSVI